MHRFKFSTADIAELAQGVLALCLIQVLTLGAKATGTLGTYVILPVRASRVRLEIASVSVSRFQFDSCFFAITPLNAKAMLSPDNKETCTLPNLLSSSIEEVLGDIARRD